MFDKLLVAVDLVAEPAQQVLTRAMALGADEIHVVHVVEPQYIQYSVDPTFTGSLTRALEEEAINAGHTRLAELCAPFAIPPDHQLTVVGRAADRIHELAESRGVDTIVVGSHARPGLQRLLGSTANAVLHNASVNVMVVRTNGE